MINLITQNSNIRKVSCIIFFTIAAIFFVANEQTYAQTTKTTTPAKMDTIIKLGGRKYVVDVLKVDETFVTFRGPNSTVIERMDRKDIQDIFYCDGRIEHINKPVLEMIEDYQWEAVLLTEDPADVEGLFKRGEINALSPPSSRSAKAAKNAAEIKIRKKAASMKAIIVLVTHKETRGGYGEMPGYYIEGIAYGVDELDENGDTTDGKGELKNGVVF
jgi:hypothetical protein